jgi:hypothetical protein
MLGTRSAQRGLFEADTLYADFVGRDTFYGWLATQRGALFSDELFLPLYVDGWGRPSVPPSLLATALVLQTYDDVSDEEATRRAAYDLQWKVALGVEVDAKPFAKSTLQEFRAQLIIHEQARTLFQESLELAKRRGTLRRDRKLRLALDTTPILGRGAVKDTYNLLADGMVRVLRLLRLLRLLARHAGVPPGDREALRTWATAAGYARYAAHALGETSVKGAVALDWDDPVARARFLGDLVADADRLLARVRDARCAVPVGSAEDTALVEAAGVLSRVLCQDVERPVQGVPGAQSEGVPTRDGPTRDGPTRDGPTITDGTAHNRLVAVHDPEMRHGRKSASKRFDGHKAAIAVDTDGQVITAVAVLAGNAPDATGALALVAQSEHATGCPVEETYGDCAYGDGQTRAAFAAAGRTLHAKVPVLPNHGGFPKTAFRITLAGTIGSTGTGPTCTCPAGHTLTRTSSAGRGLRLFKFPAAVCATCPLRAHCLTDPNGHIGVGRRTGRTILLHPQEALIQAARAFQHSPAFAEVRRRRQAAEHRLARLVQLGVRQARYVGRTKTLFQLLLAATVANLTLVANSGTVGATATTIVPETVLAPLFAFACAATAALVLDIPPHGHPPRDHRGAPPPRLTAPRLAGFRLNF